MSLTAAELIEQYTVTEGTFEIAMRGDRPVTFIVRKVTSVPEMAKVQKKAKDLLKLSESKAVPPMWKPYLPIDQATADIVSRLTELVVEPKFTDIEALELCAKAGMFATMVDTQIMMRLASIVAQGEAQVLEEAKNELPEATETSFPEPSGETTSPSDGTASESIPTTSPTTTGDTPATT